MPDSVTELINDTTDDEPCLFDRTSEWRLSPARKFNWWFGSTNDRTWLLAAGS